MTDRRKRIVGAVVGALAAAVLLPLLNRLGRMDLFFPLLAVVAIVAGVLALTWRLRGRPWFWVALALVSVVHLVLIFRVPWPRIPAILTFPACMADVGIIFGLISLLDKLMSRAKS